MGAKCDYRTVAREQAHTPRETDLVNELLSGRAVRTHISPVSSRTIVGMAGLRYEYWQDLYDRLRNAGLLFSVHDGGGRITYRMSIPVGNPN